MGVLLMICVVDHISNQKSNFMKKLKVNDLKVKSFVTAGKEKDTRAIKGGATTFPCYVSLDYPICY